MLAGKAVRVATAKTDHALWTIAGGKDNVLIYGFLVVLLATGGVMGAVAAVWYLCHLL